MIHPVIKDEVIKFYRYLTPSGFSYFIYDDNLKAYNSVEYQKIVNSEEEYIANIEHENSILNHDLFSCRNRYIEKRNRENVTFMKAIVIDIDNDIENLKSATFEEFCSRYKLYIEAKVKSREKGGYHYYIAYKPTEITNKNRDQIQKICNNLKSFLLDNNIEIDRKIFDLGRLIRIWGTYNYKRQSYCSLEYLNPASSEQIEANTLFINSLPDKECEASNNNILKTSCHLIEYCRENKLDKKDTEKNDNLIKNLAIFLAQNYDKTGLMLGRQITKFQGHNPSEFDGWWNKAVANKLTNFNCGELINWLKQYYPSLLSQTCTRCRILNKNKIDYVDSNETWHQLKNLMRQHNKLLINREVFNKGVILPYSTPYKQEIVLWKEYELKPEPTTKEIRPNIIVFFDDKIPDALKKHINREVDTFAVDLYFYNLVEEGVNYIVMSETPQEYGEYFIEGSVIKINDKIDCGNYTTINSRQKILLLHSARNIVKKIKTFDEFLDLNITYQQAEDFIFSSQDKTKVFEQPDYFNKLIFSFLLSGKYDGYPMHLCILGRKNSGKSEIMKAVMSKFSSEGYVDAASSTIKSLVPSFYGSAPAIGKLAESRRICFIDEFLNLFKGEEAIDKMTSVNNILTHAEVESGSGKGKVIVKMRAKLLANTNPFTGKNFEQSIKTLPESAVDRILIFKQDKYHYKWVKSKRHVKKYTPEINMYDFQAVYDYFNSFLVDIDESKLQEIIDKSAYLVPNFMEGFYETRYSTHHPNCILDGLVKLRMIKEQKFISGAEQQDYDEFEKLWQKIIINWYDNYNDLERERLLGEEQKALLELIKNNDGLWDYQIEKLCDEQNIEYKYNITLLVELELLEIKDRKIFLRTEKELSSVDFENGI